MQSGSFCVYLKKAIIKIVPRNVIKCNFSKHLNFYF